MRFLYKLIISIYFFCIVNLSYSQNTNNSFVVNGKIIDSNSQHAVGFASITYTILNKKKVLLSSNEGEFRIKINDTGTVRISIEALSFNVYNDSIEIRGQKDSVKHLLIVLGRKIDTLASVLVKSNHITFEAGKFTYQLTESDRKNAINTNELLGNIPYLFVDTDGQVYIKGKGRVRVLINGKPLLDNNILKNMPTDIIKHVEVLTNAGLSSNNFNSDGVINIITKKQWIGHYGSMTFGAGTNENFVHSNYFSTKSKKTEINISSGINHYERPFFSSIERVDITSSAKYSQVKNAQNTGLSPFANIGLNFSLDSLSTISYAGNIYFPKFRNNGSATYSSLLAGRMIPDYSLNMMTENNNLSFKNYIDYSKNNKDKSVLVFSVLHSDNQSTIRTSTIYTNGNKKIFNNQPKLTELTWQVDYKKSIKKLGNLNLNTKWITRNNNSSFYVDTFNLFADKYDRDYSQGQSDNFSGREHIFSLFEGLSRKIFKSWNANFGISEEFTNEKVFYRQSSIEKAYFNVIPALSIQHLFNNTLNLNIDFGKKVRRPGIYYLNPFLDSRDPRNIIVGNPGLAAEKNYSLAIAFNWSKNNNIINISAYHDWQNNLIGPVFSRLGNDTVVGTYENIGRYYDIGSSLYVATTIKKSIRISSTMSLEQERLQSGVISNNGPVFYSNINISANFPKAITIRGVFSYNSKSLVLQGYDPSVSSSEVTIRKKNKQGNMIVSVSAYNLLNINSNRNSTVNTDSFIQKLHSNLNLKYFSVQMVLNIGKIQYSTNTPVRISNLDLKNQ